MSALQDITFAEEPAVGLAIVVSGQRFDLVAAEPYERKDGTASRLLTWHADCADCGTPFTVSSGAAQMPSTRRCKGCRKPGVSVSKGAASGREGKAK